MRELLLPVAEGVDTRLWIIKRRIATLELQLRAWAAEPNPPLARCDLTQRLEDEVCQLYEALEAAEGLPQPHQVAEAIRELTQQGFMHYLDGFGDDQIVGWTGKLRWCPLALYIEMSVPIGGLRVRVYLDHVLVDDGYDEARVPLAPWAERIARVCSPPDYPAPEGTAITGRELRAVLASSE